MIGDRILSMFCVDVFAASLRQIPWRALWPYVLEW